MKEDVPAAAAAPLRLVAGLGNPGPRYSRTRHNAGFLVLAELARRHGLSFTRRGGSEQARFGSALLLRPLTFMNRSGAEIQAALTRQRLRPENLLVVHDDVDLDTGRLRFRFGGSSGGQRGVQDTINRAGRDFWRLKLGIGRAPADRETADWVLSRFRDEEAGLLEEMVAAAADAVETALRDGPEHAANRYSGFQAGGSRS